MNVADVSAAVNRWIVTASVKSQLINAILEKADMKNVKKLKGAITSTINPFKKDIDKSKLLNIKTSFITSIIIGFITDFKLEIPSLNT